MSWVEIAGLQPALETLAQVFSSKFCKIGIKFQTEPLAGDLQNNFV